MQRPALSSAGATTRDWRSQLQGSVHDMTSRMYLLIKALQALDFWTFLMVGLGACCGN